jgi:hypothetical protein
VKRLLALAACLALALPADAGPKGGGGGFSGGSSRPSGGGFSGGSKPSGGGGGSKPSFSGGSAPAPKPAGGKGPFSGGSKPADPKPSAPAPASPSSRPKSNDFNSLAVADSKKAESRRNYEKANAPAPTYKSSAGAERPIGPRDRQADYLRGRLDERRWADRPARVETFYAPYAGRPVVVYNDPYHPLWNYWLLRQSLDVQALWVYHHAGEMDRARLDALYRGDDLRARVLALERQGLPHDPTYTPAGVDPDLAYDDGYVTAAYNPRPKPADWSGFWLVCRWVFLWIPLTCLAAGAVIYLVFYRRWGG